MSFFPHGGQLHQGVEYKEMNTGIKKAIELTGDQIDSFAIDSFSNDFGLIDKNGTLLTPVR